uniref:Uncharacterized protein n=1 Tax=Rhodnius prolixus TaxID=13249 RepID=T1I3N4_RHOPR
MRQLVYFLLTFSTYIVLISGQGILPAESSLSLDPLVTLVGCLREEKPGYCLQRRALHFFESWITTQGDDEGDELGPTDDTSERLPAGLSPYWSKFVDSVADRLSKMYGDEEEEPEEVEDVFLKDNHKVNKDTKIKSRQGDSQIEVN